MVELIKHVLLNSPKGTFVLTKRLNQDPLEAYFSAMRYVGRRSEMPDVHQYCLYTNIIQCTKRIKHIKGSNISRGIDWKEGPVTGEPLPKRRKKESAVLFH